MSEYRIAELDYAKGIGIFLVVLGHTILLQETAFIEGQFIARWIYSFHMPLFFIISGIALGLKSSFHCNISNVTKRLLIPYIERSLLYTVLLIIRNKYSWKSIFLERGYAAVTGRGIAPLWFLATLFEARIFLSGFENMIKGENWGKHKEVKLLAICLAISVGLDMVLENINDRILQYPMVSLERMFLATIFVLIGYYVGVSGSLFLISLCMLLPKSIWWLAEIGKNSMDIMTLHYPPMPVLKYFIIMAEALDVNTWGHSYCYVNCFGDIWHS